MSKLLVSVQSAQWLDVRNQDEKYLDEKMKYAAECGIEALDYNIDLFMLGGIKKIDEYDGFFEQETETLLEYFRPTKEAAARHGIEFSQMHAPFPVAIYGEAQKNDYMIMVVEKCLEVCKYLNCPAIVVHPVSYDDIEIEREINFQMYRKLIPAAKKTGVKICLENLFRRYSGKIREGVCADVSEACRYIDTLNQEAGAELFGFCFDLGHATICGKNPAKYIKQLGSRLTLLHIQDTDAIHDSHMIPYTQITSEKGGTCNDWDGFIDALKEIKYEGNISFETFRAIETLPKEVEREALTLLTAIGRYFRKRIAE